MSNVGGFEALNIHTALYLTRQIVLFFTHTKGGPEGKLYSRLIFKGTVLRDRFRKCCQKLTDLGLNKGRGWFLNFSEAPLIFC
jgi:hypothetical protein